MSSIKEGLVPDGVLLLVQGGVYLCALAAANLLVVRPALRLQRERRNRTLGKKEKATALSAEAERLETQFLEGVKVRSEQARAVRRKEIEEGAALAHGLIVTAQEKARARIREIKDDISAQTLAEKQKISVEAQPLASLLLERLGVSALLGAVFLCGLVAPNQGQASGGELNVMESVFWPYFHFAIFVAIAYFAIGKILPGILAKRRENLRTQLAEAHSALQVAEGKMKEFRAQVSALEQENATLVESYKADGIRERARLVAEAEAMAAQILADAERIAQETVSRSREELRRELVDEAIRIVKEKLTLEVGSAAQPRLRSEVIDAIRTLHV